MANKLLNAFSEYDGGKESAPQILSGILGLPLGGNLTVQVPNRPGYVFVRIRDTQNEWVSAYNDEVSPVYNLPVLIQRQGNRWRIIDRDVERYENWGTNLPFLPQHGDQHSFNRAGGGGDVVWVYADQFVPLLAFPSGTSGGPNVTFEGYLLQRDSDFIFVGYTGSPNIVQYKPTNNQALMGLVYMDRRNGSFGLLMNTGSLFSASVTGTADVAPYIPYPQSYQEPLYAVRLVSGTQTIQWDNLYNARQFYSGKVTGTGGGGISDAPSDGVLYGRRNAAWSPVTGTGGGTIASGTYVPGILTPNRVIITNPSGEVGTDDGFYYYAPDNIAILGDTSVPATPNNTLHVVGSGTSPGVIGWYGNDGTGAAGSFGGFRSRGSVSAPSGILTGDGLARLFGRGHDGNAWSNTQSQVSVVADENWSASAHGAGIDVWATPTGTTTQRKVAHFYGDGNLDLTASGTYNVNGSPHGHPELAGTYSPTLTNGTNVEASALNDPFMYIRIGNILVVSGSVQVDPTAAGSATLGISLPIASNFVSSYDLNGNGTSPGQYPGSVIADTTNDRASFVHTAVDGTNRFWRLLFMYQIK